MFLCLCKRTCRRQRDTLAFAHRRFIFISIHDLLVQALASNDSDGKCLLYDARPDISIRPCLQARARLSIAPCVDFWTSPNSKAVPRGHPTDEAMTDPTRTVRSEPIGIVDRRVLFRRTSMLRLLPHIVCRGDNLLHLGDEQTQNADDFDISLHLLYIRRSK